MITFNGFARLPNKYQITRSLCSLLSLALLPVLVMAQGPLNDQESLNDQEPLVDAQEINEATVSPTPPVTHATQQAPDSLLITAAYKPENFIGKTLILHDGANAVTVGPVLNLRRRIQDQEIYLIVDATPYFKSAGEYAVAVKDVDRVEADTLVIPEAPGMHLRGLDYYPDDYTDIEDLSSAVPSGNPED